MNRILFYDTETTGVDSSKDKVIEVAGVLWDIDFSAIVSTFSTLMHSESNDALAINHIPVGLLQCAPKAEQVWQRVSSFFAAADVVVAHNAAFDYEFTPEAVRSKTKWVCTLDDVTWDRASQNKSLVAIALSYGVAITDAHRALPDCLTLAKLFERYAELGGNVRDLLAHGLRPKAKVMAVVSYRDNEKAKANGFRWDAEKKYWWRRLAVDDIGILPFEVRTLSA